MLFPSDQTYFRLQTSSAISCARRGVFQTAHGEIPTPYFQPIATRGTVKTLSSGELRSLGVPLILANAYHLWLRPGLDVLRSFGGLHRFMDWDGAILTDSGGYQVFSLAERRKITEQGVVFQSHIDGAHMELTPERSIEIQHVIGSDVHMVLDVCAALPTTQIELAEAVERTTAWAVRSKTAFDHGRDASNNPKALLFGIVQGGVDMSLREKSARELCEIGFDGYALGGLSVGEPFEDACQVVRVMHERLPSHQMRYFMGGAKPHEIVAYVQRGIDMFDCVLPTRNARHGLLYRFVHEDFSRSDFYETIHVTNERWKETQEPLLPFVDHDHDHEIDAVTQELTRISIGYVRHLLSVDEPLGTRLLTLANVRFYFELMARIRMRIEQGLL